MADTEEPDFHGLLATCSSCGLVIENEDGIWWHVDSMEMFCEPDDPDLTRQADPAPDTLRKKES